MWKCRFFPAMNTDNRNRITGKLYFFESEQGTFPFQSSADQIHQIPHKNQQRPLCGSNNIRFPHRTNRGPLCAWESANSLNETFSLLSWIDLSHCRLIRNRWSFRWNWSPSDQSHCRGSRKRFFHWRSELRDRQPFPSGHNTSSYSRKWTRDR